MSSGWQEGAARRGAEVVRMEAAALEGIAERLESAEQKAFEEILARLAVTVRGGGRIVLCGIGKSGLIARKIAATLVSLSVPALFLHPAEALHGDLGMISTRDLVLALSYSGETEELIRLVPLLARMKVGVVSLCGCRESSLARASAVALDVSIEREACAHRLAPTTSTTAMLAVGDALAVELSRALGFVPQTFAELHPGGQLGRRLTPVSALMHTGERMPVVGPGAGLPEIMHEMSAKRLGMTTVQSEGTLLGVLSDGDLRRLMEREGPEAFHRTAAEAMNAHPRTVAPEVLTYEAIERMESHKITSLVVTRSGESADAVLGIVHMHDLLQSLGVAAARG